jgi:hypothetical protein
MLQIMRKKKLNFFFWKNEKVKKLYICGLINNLSSAYDAPSRPHIILCCDFVLWFCVRYIFSSFPLLRYQTYFFGIFFRLDWLIRYTQYNFLWFYYQTYCRIYIIHKILRTPVFQNKKKNFFLFQNDGTYINFI